MRYKYSRVQPLIFFVLNKEGGPEGVSYSHFPAQIKSQCSSEHKPHCLSGCPAQILYIIPFPFSIVFLLMNPSPSA